MQMKELIVLCDNVLFSEKTAFSLLDTFQSQINEFYAFLFEYLLKVRALRMACGFDINFAIWCNANLNGKYGQVF